MSGSGYEYFTYHVTFQNDAKLAGDDSVLYYCYRVTKLQHVRFSRYEFVTYYVTFKLC